MAYVGADLVLLTQAIKGVPALYAYTSGSATVDGDAIGTINGANYFSDGQKRGLKVGDFMLVNIWTSAALVGHIVSVSAVQAVASGYGATTTLVSGTT